MAQQSSLATAIRAVVMLSCLVAVPAVAVSGKSLPEMFERLVVRSRPAAVQQEQPTNEVAEGITWRVHPEPSREEGALEGLSITSPEVGALPRVEQSPVRPTAGLAAPERPFLAQQHGPPEQRGLIESAKLVPVHRPPQTSAAEPVADSPVLPTDDFHEVERRLRQLGATYYLLELWGQSRQLYRFHCRVAVTGNPNYTRYFEATRTEALSAMREVMGQVEAWRARQ